MSRVPVETVLTARDVNTAATLRSLSSMAGGLQQAVSMAQRAFGTFNALALGGGIALGAQSLITFNQELENTTQNLAGSIQVYKYANNYADAMLVASDALEKIKRDAAALPGTDTDFIRAFSITFPEQAQLGVKTLDEAIKRSNNLTAVLLAKGVDSGQIGRDVGQMLRSHAGADVRSFMELKGQLGVKDAEEFNKKSAKKRLELLDQVIGKNKDVINAFGSTWDAVTSTGQSYLKSLATEGSKPLFELAKQNLKAINDYVGSALPQILTMATLFGTLAADAAKAGGNLAADVGKSLTPRDYATSAVVTAATPIFNTLATIGMHVVNVLKPLGEALSSVGSAIMGVLAPALAGIGLVLETAVGITGVFVRGILLVVSILFDAVGPILARLGTAFGTVYTAVTDVVIILAAKAKPYADGFVEMLRWLVTKMGQAAEWIASKFGKTGLGEIGRAHV